MSHKIAGFVICLLALLVLDISWFSISLDSFYRPLMGGLLNPTPNLVAGGAFYIIYAAMICHFAILRSENIKYVAKNAALLGLCAFATYDLTALSVIKGFGFKLALGDMAWGIFAATTAAITTRFALNQFFSKK